jgi:hypothetical protein
LEWRPEVQKAFQNL